MKYYGLYHGDELVGFGTSEELAKLHGVSERTIQQYASKRMQQQTKWAAVPVVVMDDEGVEA